MYKGDSGENSPVCPHDHSPENKNFCQGVCKFEIIANEQFVVWDIGQDFGNLNESQCKKHLIQKLESTIEMVYLPHVLARIFFFHNLTC